MLIILYTYYITAIIYLITILTYYVSVTTYNSIETEHLYPLKHLIRTALSTSLSSVYSYFTYMIGLTKRSHIAPKMQHVTFCDSIVRSDWCLANIIGVRVNMDITLRERLICHRMG